MELYKKHRPKTLDDIIGNQSTVDTLKNMLQRNTVPHTILFHGPSGCGKTTMARILKEGLGCHDIDFQELNCSDFRGIDTIRDIARTMTLHSVGGKCRVWLLDEFHQMSSAGMHASLKILEDTPTHVYFLLCTTEPQKLLKTIRTRCCEMPVEYLDESQMKKLLLRVSKKEGIKINRDIAEDIMDNAQGSARQCLVLLDKIKNIPESEWSKALSTIEEEKEGIELCRALVKCVSGPSKNWSPVANILQNINGEPETIRWAVMGYYSAILLKKSDHRIFHILTCFEHHFYDSKKNGLIRACYESVYSEF